MNLCILTYEFPPECGGAGFYIYELADALGAKGIHSHIYTRGKKFDAPFNSTVHRIPTFFPHIISYNFILRLQEKDLNDFDIVIHNECSGLWLSKKFYQEHTDLMVLYHMSVKELYTSLNRRLRLHLWQKLQDIMAFKADHFIFLNEKVAQEAQTRYGDITYSIIPSGITLDIFKRVPQPQVRAVRERFHDKTILFFPGGATNERKGLLQFLPVIHFLKQKFSDFMVVVSGYNSSLHDKVRKVIGEEGLQHYIHLTGDLKFSEVPMYYKASDIVVFPSLYEGFGRPILEAMAAGKPLVTYPVGIASSCIDQGVNGYLAHSVEELAEILGDLLRDKDKRRRIGERAEDTPLLRKYDWSVIADTLLDTINHLKR